MFKKALGLFAFILIAGVVLLAVPSHTPVVEAAPAYQAPKKLGGVDVAGYCGRRNQNAILTNNNRDWACVARDTGAVSAVLTQGEYNIACREQFGNRPGVIAVQDGTDSTPAFNWSCVESALDTNPNNLVAPTAGRLGGVDVAGYCGRRNQNATLVNNNNDWACTDRTTSAIIITLTQTEYDQACREQFGAKDAIRGRKDGNNAIGAFNWSCYDNSISTVVQTRSSGGKLGGLYVSGYCQARGLQIRLVNDGKDFACVNAFTNQVIVTLSRSDYDNLCRETYHSTAYAVQEAANPAAFGWVCYEPAAAESYGVGTGTNFTRNQSSLGATNGTLAAKPGYEVNVRAAPDLEAPKLGRINAQGYYPILGREAEWYRIDFHGQVGYVAAIWVQVKGFTSGR